jgi:hypothetical protein
MESCDIPRVFCLGNVSRPSPKFARVIESPNIRVRALPFGEGSPTPRVAVDDADLEYDPAKIDRLLVLLRDGRAEVVVGSHILRLMSTV